MHGVENRRMLQTNVHADFLAHIFKLFGERGKIRRAFGSVYPVSYTPLTLPPPPYGVMAVGAV